MSIKQTRFLPTTPDELNRLTSGAPPDFVLVTGDAYVDHPSFGAAVIGRLLESRGYVVCVLAQPDWNKLASFKAFGEPRLGFLVTGGNIDSMVSHYSVAKKRRDKDSYSPGGKPGLRPDRATVVYSNKIRAAYKNTAIIIGGLEASLRRLSHYDYWDDKVRRSILMDAGADLLVYGMGERQIIEIAERLRDGQKISELTDIRGTVYKTKDISGLKECIKLPDATASKADYAKAFLIQHENTDAITAKTLVEAYGGVYVVQNKPAAPLTQSEFDEVYNLNYARTYHPMYEALGGVPSIEEVRFSIIGTRGCFGGCSFCALTFHQGRAVTARSHESILSEAAMLTNEPDFKGYIHDVGGPTANFRAPSCKQQLKHGLCKKKQCLSPRPCKNLVVDHSDFLSLLKKIRALPRVKKVFIRSGIRYDYLMQDDNRDFLTELCRSHVSGQLKVAPEHISARVLEKMGKPSAEVYERFKQAFDSTNKRLGMEQYLVPYLMSSHPGSDLHAAIELALYLNKAGYSPEQVQDFYPTPGTLSTCMYYTETDPRTGESVYVPKHPHEKAMQRALIQYRNPKNRGLVMEALKKAEREDLITVLFGSVPYRPKKAQPKQSVQQKPQPTKRKKTIRNVHAKKKKVEI